MSPLPRRMLGSAASWENPQVRPSPLPEVFTYVGTAVAIRLLAGVPHQILNSPFRIFITQSPVMAYLKSSNSSSVGSNVKPVISS